MIKRLFWLILICNPYVLTGQSSLEYFWEVIDRDLGFPEKSQTKVDSLIQAATQNGDVEGAAEMLYFYAREFAIAQNFPVAIQYSLKALSFNEEEELVNEVYAKTIYNLGRFYDDNAEYEKAISVYQKSIDLNFNRALTAKSYAEMGWCYFNLGDIFKAVSYFKQALPILQAEEEYRSLASHTINLAAVYRKIGTTESMNDRLQLLLNADSLNNVIDLKDEDKVILKNAFANQYIEPDFYDFEQSRNLYFEMLEMGTRDSIAFATYLSYNNLSNLYNLEKRDSALYFAQQGLKSEPNQEMEARLYDNISEYYLLRKNLVAALENIDRALEVNLEDTLNGYEVPKEESLLNTSQKDHALYCLKKKVQIYLLLYEQSAEVIYLNAAVGFAKAADRLIGMMENKSLGSDTRLYWRKKAGDVYQMGAQAALLANNAEDLFYFTEKNKALLLTEEIQQNTSYERLPKNIFTELNSFKYQIFQGQVDIERNPKNQNDNTLFELRKGYESYLDSIKTVYASYFRKHPTLEPISLKETQKILGSQDALISYIWNDTDDQQALTGILIDRDQTHLFEVTDPQLLLAQLTQFKEGVSKPLYTEEEVAAFHEVASELYQKLIPAELKSKNVLIIADGPLQQIPFESLVTDRAMGSYLVQSVNLSYLYSVSFLNHSRGISREADSNLLAYAPNKFNEEELISLPHTEKEVNAIQKHFEGTFVQNAPAAKEHFIQNSSDYKMLHLATHAKGQEYAWIAFADKRLQLHELYSYRNNAELVTLSGCDTQTGVIAKGEGVLSLARGFFYSGAKTVVASQWQVSDQASVVLMDYFYKYLSQGKSKQEALTRAKRDYLNSHELSDRSPYYWASFVLIGDPEALTSAPPKYAYWLIFGVVFAIALGIRFRLKRHST